MNTPWLCRAGALVIALQFAPPLSAATGSPVQDLVQQGQYAQALTAADAALAGSPKDPELRFLKGLALTELGRRAEAIEVFQALTSDYPELPEPYNNLAVIYAQQKDFEKARTALEMAIRTHPSYATAHENLGDIYSRLASEAYSKALQLDASNAAAQTKLALVRQLITTGSAPATAPQQVAAAVPAAAAKAEKPPAPVAMAKAPATVPSAPQAPSASAPQPAAASAEADAIKARVTGWAEAWSKKDVAGYLSYYAPSFAVPGGRSRAAWEAERRARVAKPGKISVDLEDIRVELNGDKATVRFRQHYSSFNFDASAAKVLEMTRHGGTWAISREVIGG